MSIKQRILLEIFFFVVIYFAYQNEGFDIPREQILAYLLTYVILYAHGMMNRFFILPLLINQKKYLLFSVLTLATLLVFAKLSQMSEVHFVEKYQPNLLPYITLMGSIKQCLLSLFIMSTIEFVVQQAQRQKEQSDYRILQQQLESANLKAQLNPHFLFNSLNNAYGISLNEPARAPDYLMSLSQLMRYQVESTKSEFVSLAQEIEFIENYLKLEQERVGHRCTINYKCNISKELQSKLHIIPMVFICFAENAIKHGTSSIEQSFVNVEFSGNTQQVICIFENSIPQSKSTATSSGTGLHNVQKRLQMMYPKQHQLAIVEAQNTYKVSLCLNLNTL
jgi:two-component system, LytTR family, sensor kinase